MAIETLSSNIVNYLIWRYLQENGFAHAAWQLGQKWQQYPQQLPFAQRVQPHQLVEMLSDGLYYDQLQAKHTGKARRYEFGADHGSRYPQSGTTASDPLRQTAEARASRKRRRDVSSGSGAGEAERANQASRPRRAVGVLKAGDAMEIDAGVPIAAIPATISTATPVVNEPESETAVAMEDMESPVVEEPPPPPPPSTLQIGLSRALQTDPEVNDLTSNTTFLKVGDKTQDVSNTLWVPGGSASLLVTGEQLICQYPVPPAKSSLGADENGEQHEPATRNGVGDISTSVSPNHMISLPVRNPYNVNAAVFTSPTSVVVATDQDQPTMPNGTPNSSSRQSYMAITKLYALSSSSQTPRFMSSLLGTVLELRWNQTSKRLLCVSTTANEEHGCLSVISEATTPLTPPGGPDSNSITQNGTYSPTNGHSNEEPPSLSDVQSVVTPSAIYDAAWTGPDTFVAVGERLIQEWEVALSSDGSPLTLRKSYETTLAWEKVRHDIATDITALATVFDADGDNCIGLLASSATANSHVQSSAPTAGMTATIEPTDNTERKLITHSCGSLDVCEIAFQPLPSTSTTDPSTGPRVLASCSDNGGVILWDALKPFNQLLELSMGGVPALTMAWRPDAKALAGGGLDQVSVWEIDRLLIAAPSVDPVVPDDNPLGNATSGNTSASKEEQRVEIRGRLSGRWKWSADKSPNEALAQLDLATNIATTAAAAAPTTPAADNALPNSVPSAQQTNDADVTMGSVDADNTTSAAAIAQDTAPATSVSATHAAAAGTSLTNGEAPGSEVPPSGDVSTSAGTATQTETAARSGPATASAATATATSTSGSAPPAIQPGAKEVWDISTEDREFELHHRLSWDDSGKRLAFTVANQIAVIETG